MDLASCCSIVGGARDFVRMLSGGGSLSTIGLRIRRRASQATDLKGLWSQKPKFGALSVQLTPFGQVNSTAIRGATLGKRGVSASCFAGVLRSNRTMKGPRPETLGVDAAI